MEVKYFDQPLIFPLFQLS